MFIVKLQDKYTVVCVVLYYSVQTPKIHASSFAIILVERPPGESNCIYANLFFNALLLTPTKQPSQIIVVCLRLNKENVQENQRGMHAKLKNAYEI